jgi:hypothetical protein
MQTKQIIDINPGDDVVNIGVVKRVEQYANGIMITYDNNTLQFYRNSQSLVVNKKSLNPFNNLFK